MKARVEISFRPGVLDPEAVAILRAWQEIALNELAKHEMFLGIAG